MAQDSLHQNMEEFEAGLAVILEPWKIPEDSRWLSSAEVCPTIGILWHRVKFRHLPLQPLEIRLGYIGCRWNNTIILGCYFSPNRPVREFSTFLDNISIFLEKYRNSPCLVLDDFNARHKSLK